MWNRYTRLSKRGNTIILLHAGILDSQPPPPPHSPQPCALPRKGAASPQSSGIFVCVHLFHPGVGTIPRGRQNTPDGWRSARAVQLFGRLAVLETHTLRY